jgi:hypothetical protein
VEEVLLKKKKKLLVLTRGKTRILLVPFGLLAKEKKRL